MDIDIDTIVTFVFVAIIILFNVFGSILGRLVKRGQAGSDKKAKTTGTEGLLQTLKSRVNKEIRVAMDQVRAVQAGADGPGRQAGTRLQAPKTTRPIRPEGNKPKSPPSVSRREEAVLIDEIRQDLMREDIVTTTPEPRTFKSRPSPAGIGFSGEDLRRAVIWSEILAPPLALRE